ncbi:MAG: alanine--tRNA ligase [Methanobacteriota archaeon]|nr:MAG: alanine--tRNA ligase [Euryarchaeota archaeon]
MPPVDEKRIKAAFKERASREPERYYPVEVLKEEGFSRGVCSNCGTAFWSVEPREVCGEPDCSGGYSFIGDSPARRKMDFIETWREFSRLFEGLGYTAIQRYPVAARWRDDTDFVQASIYDFQPYVVSGEIEPPANPLVVPQFCLRFNDIDNVGYTGRHYTGFVMIGQHAFEPPERYAPADYLRDIYRWLVEGMGLPKEEVQFHEDAWAGGGNMGPSMEFFSRGLEIGNQVYMQYDIRTGTPRELSIKVLDMGMGQERPAWFTHGTATSYEANFGGAIRNLYRATGISPDQGMIERFLPYSGLLNFDEAEDIDRTWKLIASKTGIELRTLKEEVVPLAGLYSVADHTRSLLVALADGALPSNVGGGYNLRSLLRRALDIISTQGWNLELIDVCSWHADYLRPQYPELSEHLDEVSEILSVEERKHQATKRKSRQIVASIKGEVDLNRLITLYDSQGITPQMLTDAGLNVTVPSDFYAEVARRHEKTGSKAQTRKEIELPLEGLPGTEILYYDDYLLLEFEARVLKVLDSRYVVLDRTAFYPTSGGQLHDIGTIEGCRVTDIFKQGNVVVHVVEGASFREGQTVSGRIERERRLQLAQHHTATHIINGVARELLGEHIWQAGAEKTLEKARLDITHYEALSPQLLEEIERRANEVVAGGLPVQSRILRRDVAEREYGFRLYQGGAVPGKELRIVRIDELDVEACGGTHLKNSSEAGIIKVIGSTKIQDGVVRLEYAAGEAAEGHVEREVFGPAKEAARLLSTSPLLADDMREGLRKWTAHVEGLQQTFRDRSKPPVERLGAVKEVEKALIEGARAFSVRQSQLTATVRRFLEETERYARDIKSLGRDVELPSMGREGSNALAQGARQLFELWKALKKSLELAKEEEAMERAKHFKAERIGGYEVIVSRTEGGPKEVLKLAKALASSSRRIAVLFGVDGGVSIVGVRGDAPIHMGSLVGEASRIIGGKGGGKEDFGQGSGSDIERVDEAIEQVRREILYKLKEG